MIDWNEHCETAWFMQVSKIRYQWQHSWPVWVQLGPRSCAGPTGSRCEVEYYETVSQSSNLQRNLHHIEHVKTALGIVISKSRDQGWISWPKWVKLGPWSWVESTQSRCEVEYYKTLIAVIQQFTEQDWLNRALRNSFCHASFENSLSR